MERQQGKHILPKDRFRSLRQFFTTLHHKGSSVRLFTPSWQSTDQSVSPFNEHHTLHSAVLGLKLHILQKIRRLECFRLKPTLSLSIISCREDIGHSTKYNRDPTPTYFKTIWSWNPQVYGGMKCSTPGLTKLSAEHNIINARGNTHFTPQCNLSLPSSSAKSNWPLCRIVPELKKTWNSPKCTVKARECVDDLCIWQSKHSHRQCVHPTRAVLKHYWSLYKGDKTKNTSASPKLR